ncbi:MAG: hypothetical protein AAGF73_03840 [Actinomycetota bacterium]
MRDNDKMIFVGCPMLGPMVMWASFDGDRAGRPEAQEEPGAPSVTDTTPASDDADVAA